MMSVKGKEGGCSCQAGFGEIVVKASQGPMPQIQDVLLSL